MEQIYHVTYKKTVDVKALDLKEALSKADEAVKDITIWRVDISREPSKEKSE